MLRKLLNVFVFIGAVIFITSCGSDTNTTGLAKAQDVKALESKIDQLSEQIANLPVPTTPVPLTTMPVVTPTTPKSTLDLEQMEADANDHCLDFQANFDQKMVDQGVPEGAFFIGSCYGNRWGAVFPGMPGDTWTISLRGASPEFVDGVANIPFTTGDGTVPSGKKHPIYDDAVTIEEMVPGTVVCRMYGTEPLGTFVVSELIMKVYESSGFIFVSWAHFNRGTWSLEDDGVIPYQDGTWAVSRLTHGPCPN